MKKHLLLMLVVAGITFSFLSCSSDNDDAPSNDAPLTSLKGTEWVNNDEKDITKMLNFTTEKNVYYIERETQKGETIKKATYTFEPPIVHFTFTDEKTKKTEKHTGRVNGKTLIIEELVYTRK